MATVEVNREVLEKLISIRRQVDCDRNETCRMPCFEPLERLPRYCKHTDHDCIARQRAALGLKGADNA
jgi:hypothetical protein